MCDISNDNCKNCESLKKLNSELNLKLSRLLAAESHGRADSSCQTTSVSCDSIYTETNVEHPALTTEPYTTQPNIDIPANNPNLPCNTTVIPDLLSLSNLDNSINSTQDNLLLDIYMDSVSNSESTIPQNYVPPLIALPYISVPNQPFSKFDLAILDEETKFNIMTLIRRGTVDTVAKQLMRVG